jgi:hypothetical protein
MRRNMLDGIAKINQAKKMESGDLEIDARIAQYEMAYRMQTSVPIWWISRMSLSMCLTSTVKMR